MSDTTKPMTCSKHGKSYATFVCRHVLSEYGQGFNEAYDPDDPRPDAWCDECDRLVMKKGEWDDESEIFAGIIAICAGCYDEVRRRNVHLDKSLASSDKYNRRSWFLDSALGYHLSNPEAFHLLDFEQRQSLHPGDQVKLIFVLPAMDDAGAYFQGERMWVRVTEETRVGYLGLLESQPETQGSIEAGDLVLFGPEHVVDILGPQHISEMGKPPRRVRSAEN